MIASLSGVTSCTVDSTDFGRLGLGFTLVFGGGRFPPIICGGFGASISVGIATSRSRFLQKLRKNLAVVGPSFNPWISQDVS